MKRRNCSRLLCILSVLAMSVLLMTGCGASKSAENEETDTVRVYLWTANLYDKYAPYIQEQLPDINVEFVVGNNDLDFYSFLNENGGLPDIITCCRFSLHDALPLKNSLMDLSKTNEAGAIYSTYLASFTNQDGSVNWLPVSADAHGFVVNKALFEKYDIPLPTDYDSFVSACREFDKYGIRGFDADYSYDYTCMESLQGLSVSELNSTAGREWRTAYSDPSDPTLVGLDKTVWPSAFLRMEQFIKDTGLKADDLENDFDTIADMFKNEELAMYFGSSFGVQLYNDQGMDTTFLPFFNSNGEKWIMTTPYFQIALNRELEQDETRLENAMKVFKVMLSAEAQDIVCNGQDTLSYSQDVPLKFTDALKDARPVVEENHMYIRIASNDFFSVSKDVVSKMIAGEYNAEQAYEAFDSQLREPASSDTDIILSSDESYSNYFHNDGGNKAYSVMANSLRNMYGSDVLIATADSFTGNVLKADYTEKMAGNMIMPNHLKAYSCKISGAELKELVNAFVEGYDGGLIPFNSGSLPTVSGISMEINKNKDAYTLSKLTKDGKEIKDDESFTVTCLATEKHMTALLGNEQYELKAGDKSVKDAWTEYLKQGGDALAAPEQYISLR